MPEVIFAEVFRLHKMADVSLRRSHGAGLPHSPNQTRYRGNFPRGVLVCTSRVLQQDYTPGIHPGVGKV